MSFIGIFLLVLFLISSILLIIIVLLQDDQGDGIGGLFGGGSSSAFGSRSGNILTKTTSILGAIFLLCSFGMAFVSRSGADGDTLGEYRKQSEVTSEAWWDDSAVEAESETTDSSASQN